MRTALPTLAALLAITLAGCLSAQGRMDKGDRYHIQGRFDLALEQYRIAKHKDPTLAGLESKILRTEVSRLIHEGDRAVKNFKWDLAERAYAEARRLDPENKLVDQRFEELALAQANDRFQKGREFLDAGNPFDAIPEFEAAIALQPDHRRAVDALDRARYERRELEEKSESEFETGMRAKDSGLFHEALKHFTAALKLHPYHVGAERELRDTRRRLAESLVAEGDTLMADREFADAASAFREAFKHSPEMTGLDHRIRSAEHEAKAARLVTEADLAFDRGGWATACQLYGEARRLTSEPERFMERYEKAREKLAAEVYEQGQVARNEGRFREALEKYAFIEEFYPAYRDASQLHQHLTVNLETADHAYDAACRAQECHNLQLAQQKFGICEEAILGYRAGEYRARSVEEALSKARGFYERAVQAESGDDHERARVLFEECLAVSNPFRDAGDRLAFLQRFKFEDANDVPQYEVACRAQNSRNLERARKLFRVCLQAHSDYRDVTERMRQVEAQLESASRIYDRGREAEKKHDLASARDLYAACLAICEPFSDATKRLKRTTMTLRLMKKAQRLERENRLVAAKDHYERALKRYKKFQEAKKALKRVRKACQGLEKDYTNMVALQDSGKFRQALTQAFEIRKQCKGYKDVDERIPDLELEADYADGCAYESRKSYETAMTCFERIAKRYPGFRDVKIRMNRCAKAVKNPPRPRTEPEPSIPH